MILLDGRKISSEIKTEIKADVERMLAAGQRAPHLAAILVGTNGASESYVSNKVKSCHEVGFTSSLFRYEDSVSEEELLKKIEDTNQDKRIDGLIVQLPLPSHISVRKVTEAIHPSKDVDGFHPVNAGRMIQNIPGYIPATPLGILMMLEREKIPTEGKHCVVLGRSNIVGMPMSILMARNWYPGNCTVTLCHSKTKNLEAITREADILVAALGRPQFVKGNMVKEGVVVVDVGITRMESTLTKSGYKLFGDVHFDEVSPKASYITPVPGGVGLMTIAGLLKNTLSAARREFIY
jgi:methylenetetrahydrofolate dehydrogenase (NADP+) / methenyltetrahydrofolate cyclohydrolase